MASNRKRRAPGDGGLFMRADGQWVGTVELPVGDNGVRRQKRVYSSDYRKTKLKLDELKAAVGAGLVILTGNTTVSSWLNYWLNDVKKPKLTQST